MDNSPLPRRNRVRLFRGEYAEIWKRRLVKAGWPQPLAGDMAAFLTGDGPLPQWPPQLDPQAEIDRYVKRMVAP